MCCIQISGIKKQPSLHWYPLQKAVPWSHFSSGCSRDNTDEQLRRYGEDIRCGDGTHKNLNMIIFFFLLFSPVSVAWPLGAAASEIIGLYSWLEESFLSVKPPRNATHFSQSCKLLFWVAPYGGSAEWSSSRPCVCVHAFGSKQNNEEGIPGQLLAIKFNNETFLHRLA